MKHIKLFEELYSSGNNEKDLWWDKNYDKLIDIASEFGEDEWIAILKNKKLVQSTMEETGKHKALTLFNMLSIEKLDELLADYMNNIEE